MRVECSRKSILSTSSTCNSSSASSLSSRSSTSRKPSQLLRIEVGPASDPIRFRFFVIISMKVYWEVRAELACDSCKSEEFSSIKVTSVLKSMISTAPKLCSDLSDSDLHNSFVGIICPLNQESACRPLSSRWHLFCTLWHVGLTKLTVNQQRGKNFSHDTNTPPQASLSLKLRKKIRNIII